MEKDNEIKDEVIKDEVVVDETPKAEDKPEDKPEEINFDPSAFSETPIAKVDEEEAVIADEVKTEDEGNGLDWITDEDSDTPPAEVEDAPKPEDKVKDNPPADDVPPVETDGFKKVAEELGLKFDTIDEFKSHLETVEEENNRLREASGSGATNEAIVNLQNLLSKDDTELVRLALEKDGFEGESLNDAVDKYIDNGMIEIEAKKIRNTVNNAIIGEQNKVTQSTVDADAKQREEHAESVKKLEEHISKTDTMFGFKMSKDEDGLKKVQQGHAKYITSGKFMDDVFANDQSLAEAAWFVRNKDVIIKAIANQNLQKGKQSVLDDIRQPEVVSPQRFRDPEGSNEFDPSKFTARGK